MEQWTNRCNSHRLNSWNNTQPLQMQWMSTSCSYTVAEPAALTCVATGTNVSCNGGSNGTATSTPTGGTSPYTYLWSNGQTDATATGLLAGTYTATVTDANGCTTSCSYTVAEPAALTCVATGTNVSCNGGSNGTATSTPTGGTSPYTYLWSNGQTDATATGLIAGTYTATVTDANGCTTSCSYTVAEPAALTCVATGTNVSCNGGSNGTATSTPTGGTSPYTYLWSNGQTNATATGLIAGTYTATVTDANGCTTSCSYPVTEPAVLTCVGSGTNVSCNGGNNGTATSTPAGGTSPYTYLWSNGQTNATATGLIAGTYTAIVTDAIGCTTSCSYPVTEPAVLTCVGSGTNVSCNGGNNGTATSTPAGGTSPYTYLWSNGQTNATATDLIAGTYTATVIDANGCTTSCSYTVAEPAALTCVGSGTNVSCNGGNNGTATSTPAGGTSPYTYLWSNGQTNATATGLIAGTYTATVTDAIGCTTSCSYPVTEPAVLTCVGSGTNVSCNGGNNGTATSTPTGGTSPYTYLWSNGQTNATATGLISWNIYSNRYRCNWMYYIMQLSSYRASSINMRSTEQMYLQRR
ncbi:MAG: SprB repeat-containing protein [Bacteroidetes bacterium]|nr:SprB repeat-containing protein [Bacteroidota bacterium]